MTRPTLYATFWDDEFSHASLEKSNAGKSGKSVETYVPVSELKSLISEWWKHESECQECRIALTGATDSLSRLIERAEKGTT